MEIKICTGNKYGNKSTCNIAVVYTNKWTNTCNTHYV